MHSSSFSQAGPKGENQDRVLEMGSPFFVYAIADGVGGNFGGDIAAELAVREVENYFKSSRSDVPDFQSLFSAIKVSLTNKANELGQRYEQMGTTLTIAKFSDGKLFVGHVGDCRVYHLRGEGLKTITKDHTEIQYLIDEGVVSRSVAKRYHRRNVITSLLSPIADYTLDILDVNVIEGDKFIMLSDGSYKNIRKKEIIALANTSVSEKELTDKIKQHIEASRPSDDFSMICIFP